MPDVTVLGLAAAFCTTFAYLPQVIKTWRTRHTEGISLGMFLVMVTGLVLWLLYGLALGDVPLIVGNGITIVFTSTILYFKLRHG